jgi:DNA-binding SARP family transcriptional activator
LNSSLNLWASTQAKALDEDKTKYMKMAKEALEKDDKTREELTRLINACASKLLLKDFRN